MTGGAVAEADEVPAFRLDGEMRVERGDAEHVRGRDAERARDEGEHLRREVAKLLLHVLQDGYEPRGPPAVAIEETPAAEILTGPVRVSSKREVVWLLRAREPGLHRLSFRAGAQAVSKELAVGDGFMRVSPRRPDWDWSDALLNPAESAFPRSSPVRWIEVAYPDRSSWTSGADHWLIYWFVMSMVAAFCAKPAMNVNI